MLYPFYGSYTKIFTIFGSAHDLIHKIKHKTKTAQKEKENATVSRAAQELGLLAGLLPLGPSGHCARHPPPLTQTLTGGSRPSASPSTSRHRSGDLQLNTGELPASAARQASFPSSLRTRRPPLHPLSPTLAATATDAADGHLGRANAGHIKQVERERGSA